MTFGERVFHRRHELGLSQTDLAKALDVSVGTINKIEHGRIKESSKTAKKLVEMLKIGEHIERGYLTGYKEVDLAIIEKRINNAIYELELILDTVRSMKGETNGLYEMEVGEGHV